MENFAKKHYLQRFKSEGSPKYSSLLEIDKLRPFLMAVLREGLRVFSAIPFLEPREVVSSILTFSLNRFHPHLILSKW